jgi:ribonuclease T2
MRLSKQWWAVGASIACLLLADVVDARYRRRQSSTPGQFSYYLLALSYVPDFCARPGDTDARECGAGRRLGFVVHGLWPEGESARGPEFCGSASPVSQGIVQAMLRYMPTESLIQHEWASHGTCSGLSAGDYFGLMRRARDSVHLPAELNQPSRELQLSPPELEAKLAAANPSFPKDAFRTACYRDGELEEVRVCMSKNLSARACGSSAGECGAARVRMLPVR